MCGRTASWDILEREDLLYNVKTLGPYFQAQLQTLRDNPLVGDVRGMGLMAAVEMTIRGKDEADLLDEALKKTYEDDIKKRRSKKARDA